jgi:transcriptional regulator with XRE-family HTH domain
MTPAQLRRWRTNVLNATQEVAARAIGMSVDGYIKLENGQRPIKPWIAKLTRYITRYGVIK